MHTQGGKLFSVQTGSMIPALEPGDLTVVTRVPTDALIPGDIVTFVNPDDAKQTITHRIVELPNVMNGDRFVTKGDANNATDAPILPGAIIGKVDAHVPYVGYAVDFVRQPLGLLLIVYIPALLIIIEEIRRLSAHYKMQQPYALRRLRALRGSSGGGSLNIGGTMAVILVASALLAVPVSQAALNTSATLTGNSISTAAIEPPEPPEPGTGQVLFRKLTLRCSLDNTLTANKRPQIVLYNTERRDTVDVSGWKIADNSGVIVTLPANTLIKRAHKLTITPLLSNGLDYAGDRLILQNSAGQNIDTLSWGTDTSQFNPSIAGVTAGTKAKRFPVRTDTNTATDWRLNQNQCRGGSDPTAPAGQGGGNDPDCYDTTEADRTTVVGMFHMLEQQSSDSED